MPTRHLSRKTFVGMSLGAISLAASGASRPILAQEASPVPAIGSPMPDDPWVNGVEQLVYNNPFGQAVAPFWYEEMKGFHLNLGLATDEPPFQIAEQYLFVYEDAFQEPVTAQEFAQQPKVPGQFVVFDSVPGDANYSPIWHNNWVLVPHDYEPNSIRSVDAVQASGYRVEPSQHWIN